MDSANNENDLINQQEVFIVMHYTESHDTPQPLSANGYNVARTVCVFNVEQSAFQYAHSFAMHRKLRLEIDDEDSSQGEWHDHSNARLGYGWELVVRQHRNLPRLQRKAIWRELVWVECQWMDKIL